MKVTLLGPDDLEWPLGRQDTSPRYNCGAGSHGREMLIDPHPAYPPDRKLVEELTAECHARWPLTGDYGAELFILSHEFIGRNNGLSFSDCVYYRDDVKKEIIKSAADGQAKEFAPIAHTIVLCAKRIPIPPAMVKYLVAHEYGHVVFNRVRRLMGYEEHADNKLYEQYMAARGVTEYPKKYIAGKWHLSPSEIVANDFRTLVMGRELDFWPHDIPLPHHVPAIVKWWEQAEEISKRGAAAPTWQITVNGVDHQVAVPNLTYDELIALAGFKAGRVLSVIVKDKQRAFCMSPTETLKVTDGMDIDAVDTSNA